MTNHLGQNDFKAVKETFPLGLEQVLGGFVCPAVAFRASKLLLCKVRVVQEPGVLHSARRHAPLTARRNGWYLFDCYVETWQALRIQSTPCRANDGMGSARTCPKHGHSVTLRDQQTIKPIEGTTHSFSCLMFYPFHRFAALKGRLYL